jgi:hypothetical protein
MTDDEKPFMTRLGDLLKPPRSGRYLDLSAAIAALVYGRKGKRFYRTIEMDNLDGAASTETIWYREVVIHPRKKSRKTFQPLFLQYPERIEDPKEWSNIFGGAHRRVERIRREAIGALADMPT